MKITISIYSKNTGKEPYSDWEDSLDVNIRAIITTRLDRIKLGNFGNIESVKGTKGIFEIKFDIGPGYRIYFGKVDKDNILLLIGGDKGSQNKDIEKAKKFWIDAKE